MSHSLDDVLVANSLRCGARWRLCVRAEHQVQGSSGMRCQCSTVALPSSSAVLSSALAPNAGIASGTGSKIGRAGHPFPQVPEVASDG